MSPLNRRDFVKGAAAFTILASARSARTYAANESVTVGCIGTGGRARMLMDSLKKVEGVRINAACDLYEPNLKLGLERSEEGAFATQDHRALLERKDVDAVLIGTPDHWHVPITIDACEAGKDVYVEKPLTHDVSEGPRVIEAQGRTGKIVQVGMQQRSMTHLIEAYDVARSGKIGTIHKVHLSWNRNSPGTSKRSNEIPPEALDWKHFLGSAPDQPYDDFKFRHWRWFWDFGGGIFTDLMVHFIDVVHWYMHDDKPASAVSIGDFYDRKDLWETPDTVQTLLQYPDKEFQAHFEGTFINAYRRASITFMGSKANLYLDRGRFEIIPEWNAKMPLEKKIYGSGPKGADFYDHPDGDLLHLQNWIDCVRSRKEPNAPVEVGVSAADAAHLANRALRNGGVAQQG